MEQGLKLTLSLNNDVPQTSFGDWVVSEFKKYKELSYGKDKNNFVTPNEYYQANNPSLHNLFGRDRVFDYPEDLLVDIHFENLAHVHFDKDEEWSETTNQWFCTSRYSIVYSGFKVTDNHLHVVIHDLLINESDESDFDAHNFYTREDVNYYLDSANYYREHHNPNQCT